MHKSNNQVKGNKPIEIGYEFSCVGLSGRRPLYGSGEPPWNLPLSMRVVPFRENRNSFTARQVNDLMGNTELPLHKSLTVNALDSNYSRPEYIAGTNGQANLVNIIRLPSNPNIWEKLSREEQMERREGNTDNRGADAIYWAKYKLTDVS